MSVDQVAPADLAAATPGDPEPGMPEGFPPPVEMAGPEPEDSLATPELPELEPAPPLPLPPAPPASVPASAPAPAESVLPELVEVAEPVDPAELRAALEAILLVVDEPVTEASLAQVLEQPADRLGELLRELSFEYTAAGRGFDLRRAAGGWRLYTRTEQAPYVQRFILDGQQARLTQAALETLAVIAYRQPMTRSRVSAIRGVNCDGVIRTLLTRGLVEEIGTEPETGAYLYRTTAVCLEKLGLDSLDQLPPLAPFLPDDVSAFDPDAPEPPLAAPAPAPVPAAPVPAAPAAAAAAEFVPVAPEPERSDPDPELADPVALEPERSDPVEPEPGRATG